MVRVFQEITSTTNNLDPSHDDGERVMTKGKKESTRYSVPNETFTEDWTKYSEESISDIHQSESEGSVYSYASRSEDSNLDDDSNIESGLSSEYKSTDYESSNGSAMSYNSSESSDDDRLLDTKFLKDVQKKTKKVEEEYQNNTERTLRAIHLSACRHLRVREKNNNFFF